MQQAQLVAGFQHEHLPLEESSKESRLIHPGHTSISSSYYWVGCWFGFFFFLFSVFPSAQQIWHLLGRHHSHRDGAGGWRDPWDAAPGTRDCRQGWLQKGPVQELGTANTQNHPCASVSLPSQTCWGATQALQGNETMEVALPAPSRMCPQGSLQPQQGLWSAPSPTSCFSPCSLAIPKLHPKPPLCPALSLLRSLMFPRRNFCPGQTH